MIKKRITSLILILMMAISMVACGGNDKSSADALGSATPTLTPDEDMPIIEEPDSNDIHTLMRKDMTAKEVVLEMGNGINLGETMEAKGGETAWGQPFTESEMIANLKANGFDTLRIPVAWVSNAMVNYTIGQSYRVNEYDKEELFKINEQYLDRVETIVNYALSEGMYVIINDHSDENWWTALSSVDPNKSTTAFSLYEMMWKQIAEHFKDYGDHLLFESGNEELGDRLESLSLGTEEDDINHKYKTVNKVNQLFVDTVRRTGGNNETRFLVVAGYNANIDATVDERFVMPIDLKAHKLILSVHYYDPWEYCKPEGAQFKYGLPSQLQSMNDDFKKLRKFSDLGYGIIVDEFGVFDYTNSDIDNYYGHILDNCNAYGYACAVWDGGEFYDRNSLSFRDDSLIELFKKNKALKASSNSVDIEAEISMGKRIAAAKAAYDVEPLEIGKKTVVAWLMYMSDDAEQWYCPKDTYDPSDIGTFAVANDVIIEGEGEYTVSLDFTNAGGAQGIAFLAINIKNGEKFYQCNALDIKSIKINDRDTELVALPYTASNDGETSRVNIYNKWVSELPEGLRVPEGQDKAGASPIVIDPTLMRSISTIEVTFDFLEDQWE